MRVPGLEGPSSGSDPPAVSTDKADRPANCQRGMLRDPAPSSQGRQRKVGLELRQEVHNPGSPTFWVVVFYYTRTPELGNNLISNNLRAYLGYHLSLQGNWTLLLRRCVPLPSSSCLSEVRRDSHPPGPTTGSGSRVSQQHREDLSKTRGNQ